MRFLALLEMFKQGWVDLEQAGNFGELHIAWIGLAGEDEPGGVTAARRHRRLRGLSGGERGGPPSRPCSWSPTARSSSTCSRSSSRSPPIGSTSCAPSCSPPLRGRGRRFTLVKVAGGYRFQSHPDLAAYVERFVLRGQSSRLSAAALETLAIVAYKQPISGPRCRPSAAWTWTA